MSQTVDHRVVEMRFDNKQFEAGAKETMGTLGRLKEALKLPETSKALEGIDKATKNISLDGIAAGVEALQNRFSTLGIVGMRVIENITDGLMNKVAAAVNFVTDSIVSGGIKRAMNIENAHFQLQALLKDEEKVQAVMNNAMESVDGTAYAYDEAAKAASQFAASGIQAGESMLNALKGITGVAAMTNSDFESISRIFTTIAGNGRLMGDQLLQLSSRGLNAASTIAEYFREVRGEAGMTEATIREMVSDGLISFQIFSDAMTWAFGDSAKRANETFTGALSNMKSALARIGAGFVSPLVEQNGELVQFFNALRIKINDVKSALVFDEQRSAIAGLGDATKMSKEELTELFSTIKSNGKVSIENLDALSKKGANAYSALAKYINGVSDGSIRATYSIKTAVGELTEGTRISVSDIRKFVEEGKIDLAMFTSAMETEFGTEKTLSKQFTDWFQDHVHAVVEAINKADVTKPMEAFYYWVESAKNLAKGLISVLKPVGKAFSDVFLVFNMDDVITFSDAVEKLTSKLKMSERGSKNLHDAFKGLFDVGKLLLDIFINLLGVIVPIDKPISEIGGGLLELAGNSGRALSQFVEWIRNSEKISKVYDLISFGVEKTSEQLTSFIKNSGNFMESVKNFPLVQKVINAVREAIEKLGNTTEKFEIRFSIFREVLSLFFNIVKKSGPIATTIFNTLGDVISKVIKAISEAVSGAGFNGFIDLLNTGLFVGIAAQISNFMKNISGSIGGVKGLFSGISKTLTEVKNVLISYQNELKSNVLKNIAVAVGILAGSLIILSMIDSEKLGGSLGVITIMIGELFAFVSGLDKVLKNSQTKMTALSVDLILMSTSVLILSAALKKVSEINSDKIVGSLGAITALLIEMTGVSVILSKYGGKIKTGVIGIIAFSAAIYILSSSIKKLGELDIDTLTKGLVSIGILLGELTGFMMGAKFGQFKASQAVGIIILSEALIVLQKAVDSFGNMDTKKLITGIIAIGGVLTEIAAFSLASGESKHILSSSVSLIIMAKALEMLEQPMNVFGSMDLSKIGKGLLAMGGALGELTIAMRLMPKNTLTIGVGLIAAAEGIATISDVVLKMSKMTWEEIGKGMVALAGSITILAVSMNLMKGTLGASAAMLVMSSSLAILVPVLKTLGDMTWEEIGKGMVALASGFIIIGAAGALLSPIIPAMLGLATAIGVIGIAAAAAGIGILALSVGLTTLAASGVAGAAALVEVAKILVIGFLNTISDSSEALRRTIKTLVITSCDVLVDCIPTIVKSILVSIKEILAALTDNTPEIVSQLLKLIIGIINALSADLPILIQAVLNLFVQFFSGLVEALKGIDTNVLIEAIVGIGLISSIMLALAGMGSLAPSAMVGVLAMGAVIAELTILIAAIGALAQIPGLKWLIGEGGDLLENIGTSIGKFIGGIIGGVLGGISTQLPQIGTNLSSFMVNLIPFITLSKMINAESLASVGFLAAIIVALTASEIINGIANLFGLSLVDMATELSSFMIALVPFITTSKLLNENSMRACEYLASMIIKLTAAELLTGIANFFGIGRNLSDFGKELESFGPHIKEFAETIKDVKPEAVEGAAAAAEIMAELANKLPGTGGLVQQIFGSKSLAEFGEELKTFGPKIAQFAEDVKDVKPEAVEGAAAAAEIMTNLADKLPPQRGFVQKIFGSKSLAEFGEELTEFGPRIAQFADQVKDINGTSVTGCSVITTIMSNLANNLPESDTLWNKIFGGGQVTLSEFGEQLVSFGISMSKFSISASGINVEQINGVITSFKDLVDLSEYVNGASASGLVDFSKELAKIGVDSVDKFVQAFTDGSSKASTAVNSLFTSVINALMTNGSTIQSNAVILGNNLCSGIQTGITQKQPSLISTETALTTSMLNTLKTGLPMTIFNTIGQNIVEWMINGINIKKPLMLNNLKSFCTSLINQLKTSLPSSTFNTIGQNIVEWIVYGINSKKALAISTISSLCIVMIEKFRAELPNNTFKTFGENLILWISQGMDSNKEVSKATVRDICNAIIQEFASNLTQDKFVDIGANAALGLKYGIESKIGEIASAAIRAAQEAVDAAKNALDEHSPSKVAWIIGEFFSIGLANGIVDNVKAITKASTEAANEAIDPMKDVFKGITTVIDSGDFDMDPVIRPVMDLSDVEHGVERIASMMNETYDLSSVYDKVMDTSSSFRRNTRNKNVEGWVAGDKNNGFDSGDKYEFNQYNYSPKALTRSEIYRQTNNQFSAFRRAVESK